MNVQILAGSRILVVEDEYFLADETRAALDEAGAVVIGPVPTAGQADALIGADDRIDCVLLDINLRGQPAFDFADLLKTRRIPFAFVTGYERAALPERFTDTPTINKPVDTVRLIELVDQLTRGA